MQVEQTLGKEAARRAGCRRGALTYPGKRRKPQKPHTFLTFISLHQHTQRDSGPWRGTEIHTNAHVNIELMVDSRHVLVHV